jgi:hypothetical protein
LHGARLEGWPRGPWFETALKKRLLTMRFPCGRATSRFIQAGPAKGRC